MVREPQACLPADGPSLRLKKPGRNVSTANHDRQPAAATANEMSSMDFVSDALCVDQGIKGGQVVEAMTRITLSRGAPRR